VLVVGEERGAAGMMLEVEMWTAVMREGWTHTSRIRLTGNRHLHDTVGVDVQRLPSLAPHGVILHHRIVLMLLVRWSVLASDTSSSLLQHHSPQWVGRTSDPAMARDRKVRIDGSIVSASLRVRPAIALRRQPRRDVRRRPVELNWRVDDAVNGLCDPNHPWQD
jgi:hypothetical protein